MEDLVIRRESFGTEEKRVRRDSLGKEFEKKLSMKPEFSIQKCREEIALYSAQTEKYFQEERGLSSVGLNPRVAAKVAFVTDADLEDLFGKCTKLRTTNTFLSPAARNDLMELYSKIYGSRSVTNNEFSGWLVKGYIATLKKKKVNWSLAASTTATEKADRAHRVLLRLLNPESSDDATASGLKQSTCTSQRGGISSRHTGAIAKAEGAEILRPVSTPSGLGFRSGCPYGVSATDVDAVRGVSEIENELLLIATSKVKYVESDYKKISDRLVGIKFTMDDRRITAKEDEEKVRQVESDLERGSKAVSEMELQASGLAVGSADYEDFTQRLGILRGDRDSAARRVDVSRFVAESSRDRAIKGADIYQDIEEEQMRTESDLEILRREIVKMTRHAAAVEDQRLEMVKGGGLSLWPKPALHPAIGDDLHLSTTTLQLHPCVFCNRGYPYFDIVVASCKHIYHIFCAAACAKVDIRCTRCAEIFHPNWWQNFGFRGVYEGFEDERDRLDLAAKEEELRQSLKQNGSRHVMNWSQSSLKHSDWGSTGSIQRSVDHIFRGQSTATTEVHRLPSFASICPSEEEHDNTDMGLTISNSRPQEVDSPVKNLEGNQRASKVEGVNVNLETVMVATEGQRYENSEVVSEPQLLDIPRLRGTLLKRPSDLPFDDVYGRKKVALSQLGEKATNLASDNAGNVEYDRGETVECRPLDSAIEKGKGKAKNSKRKICEQPPCTFAGRVATRAEMKKK